MFIYIQVKAYLERVMFEIPPKQQFSRGFWHIASIGSISNKTQYESNLYYMILDLGFCLKFS